jgi:hypothetical protein
MCARTAACKLVCFVLIVSTHGMHHELSADHQLAASVSVQVPKQTGLLKLICASVVGHRRLRVVPTPVLSGVQGLMHMYMCPRALWQACICNLI